MKTWEVIIIGGSYAGLSAALALGRSLRRVLVIDAAAPCNRFTPKSHNFLAHDGTAPFAILQEGQGKLWAYETVVLVNDQAVHARPVEGGYSVVTATGKEYTSQKLIFATGIKDLLPDIPGFKECWGKSVIHCPYCHGYEFRSQPTALLANGEKAMHLLPLVRQLTNNVTLLTSGKPEFSAMQWALLEKYRVPVVEERVTELEHDEGQIKAVHFDSGQVMNFGAVYAVVPFAQATNLPQQLGCRFTEHGYLHVDSLQKTTVAGVFACGDSCGGVRSVANAVASGNLTGALVNAELARDAFL